VQVTSSNWGKTLLRDPAQLVTQVLCSACPVAYSRNPAALWQPLAHLVLQASYEATLLVAVANAARHGGQAGSKRVFLTMLGGGAFGNRPAWIVAAMATALKQCAELGWMFVLCNIGNQQTSKLPHCQKTGRHTVKATKVHFLAQAGSLILGCSVATLGASNVVAKSACPPLLLGWRLAIPFSRCCSS
jgi:hypothetical protein